MIDLRRKFSLRHLLESFRLIKKIYLMIKNKENEILIKGNNKINFASTRRSILIWGSLFFLLIGCQAEKGNDTFSGEFKGYWAETSWQYKFYNNNKFDFKSEGHYGFIESNGIYEKKEDSLFLTQIDSSLNKHGVVNSLYLIDGDSCIIDVKLKYDYCKTREWSEMRLIKYPQIKTSDSKIVLDIEEMLQEALQSEQINEQITDKRSNLIIENYYLLNSDYKNQLEVFGKQVVFKSKEEIEKEGIKNYVHIKDINFNKDYTSFSINVISPLHLAFQSVPKTGSLES